MKKTLIVFLLVTAVISSFFLGCGKSSIDKSSMDEFSQKTSQQIKKDSFYIRLSFTYSPDIIAKRALAVQKKLDSVSYYSIYNSLTPLRNYYFYQLQERYKMFPAAIMAQLQKDCPAYFNSKGLPDTKSQTIARSVYLMECPDGLLFNPEINICDWPENVTGGVSCYFFDDETGMYYPYAGDCDEGLGSDCPSKKEMAEKLNCTEDYFHNTLKKAIIKDFESDLQKLGCTNPDICLNPKNKDCIMFKCQNSTKSLRTNMLLSKYHQP